MTIDQTVLRFTTGICLLFLVIHIVLFRKKKEITSSYDVLWLFIISYVLSCVLGLIIGLLITDISDSLVLVGCVSYMLVALFVNIYLFGVFTIADSSIRFGMIQKIYHKKRITAGSLQKIYSSRNTVKKRLRRLVLSKEVQKTSNTYVLTKENSLLGFRERITRLLEQVYSLDT